MVISTPGHGYWLVAFGREPDSRRNAVPSPVARSTSYRVPWSTDTSRWA
jgi:hypothetical protein